MAKSTGKSRKTRKERASSVEHGQQVNVYGYHAVFAALRNPARRIEGLWALPNVSIEILDAAKARGIAIAPISKEELHNIIGEDALHQGVMLKAHPLPEPALEDFLSDWQEAASATVVVLDQIADGRNLGAILRSALCLGADAVLCTDRHSAKESSHLTKTASGALEAMPLIRVHNLARALEQLKAANFWCYGFAGEADEMLNAVRWPSHVALVFGAEHQGLRRLSREHCDMMVAIPQNAKAVEHGVDSLNLGQSVSIGLYARRFYVH